MFFDVLLENRQQIIDGLDPLGEVHVRLALLRRWAAAQPVGHLVDLATHARGDARLLHGNIGNLWR